MGEGIPLNISWIIDRNLPYFFICVQCNSCLHFCYLLKYKYMFSNFKENLLFMNELILLIPRLEIKLIFVPLWFVTYRCTLYNLWYCHKQHIEQPHHRIPRLRTMYMMIFILNFYFIISQLHVRFLQFRRIHFLCFLSLCKWDDYW